LVVRGKQRLHEIIKNSNAFISNYLVYKYLNFAYDMPATGTCNSQILQIKQQGLTGITYAPPRSSQDLHMPRQGLTFFPPPGGAVSAPLPSS